MEESIKKTKTRRLRRSDGRRKRQVESMQGYRCLVEKRRENDKYKQRKGEIKERRMSREGKRGERK